MNALTQELVELLSLEKIEENIFRGQSRNLVGKRVFGGQVLGQALRAASYTIGSSSSFFTCILFIWWRCERTDYL